jgi:outer membrane protein assembly factor BamB
MSERMKTLTPKVERDLAPGAQRKHKTGIGATLLVGLLTFCLLSAGELLHADELTAIQPSGADSYMKQNLATTNFGAQTAMIVTPESANNWRGIVRFDLSSITSTAAVKTSFLNLVLQSAPEANRTHGAYRVTGTTQWTETGATWDSRDGTPSNNWTTPGGDFNATAVDTQATGTTAGTTISWTILGDGTTANIPQGWLDGSLPNLGLVIKDANENSGTTQVSYDSNEAETSSNRPSLVVHYLRDVTLAVPTAGISEVTLAWTFPSGSTSSNYDGVLISKLPGAAAPSALPADGLSYAVGSFVSGSEAVTINSSNFATLNAIDENGANSVILPSTQYTYKAFTHDSTTITGAATPAPPHYSNGVASLSVTTLAGGGTSKNWSYKTAGTALAPPGLDPGNKVVVGSNDSNVHSMSALNGARRYRPAGSTGTTGGTVQSRPAVISQSDTSLADCDPVTGGVQPCDVAYVGSDDGRVYAFDIGTGQQIWVTPAIGSAGALVGVGGLIHGGVAVQIRAYSNSNFTSASATDLVFVGTRETSASANKVYALNANTGAIVWAFSPGNMDAVNSTPVVDYANNVIWVTSLSNGNSQPSLWKISGLTGAGVSNFSLGDISGSPTLNGDNKVVYAVTDSGNLVAVRNDLFACSNTLVTGASSGTGFPIPIGTGNLRDENIFFTTTTAGAGTIRKAHFLYNTTCGGETFTAAAGYTNPSGIGTISGPMFNPLTAAAIYVGASDGKMYKVDPANGAVLANRTVNAGITIGEPSFDVFLNKLYIGDVQGRVYSFDVF